MTDLAHDRDDIQALMAPRRTPNVYAALENLQDEPTPEAPTSLLAPTAAPATPMPQAIPVPAPEAPPAPENGERTNRQAEWSAWSALAADATESPDVEGNAWVAMGAEPVGPEVLRWRREDDDIVPSGAAATGRGIPRLRLRRRSAA